MTPIQPVKYLIQVALPFIVLGALKSDLFFIPVGVIAGCLPFAKARTVLINYWQRLGLLLSRIVSPVVLSLIYYLGLTPLALLRRLFSEDLLVRKAPGSSNFKEVSAELKRDDFENLW
jgi:hypothetical protein